MDEKYGRTELYNKDGIFEEYLGRTSYYKSLQDALLKIVEFEKPSEILELGSGIGSTTNRIACMFPDTKVIGVDKNRIVTEEAKSINNKENIKFINMDMLSYIDKKKNIPGMVVFLYAFNRIPDPRENKQHLLENCYEKLPDGGMICIADVFLPDEEYNLRIQRSTRNVWSNREIEAYASTFWETLDGIDSDSIHRANRIGNMSRSQESEAGENVAERKREYLVTQSWVTEKAEEIGFEIVLSEPVNSIQDFIIVLQK